MAETVADILAAIAPEFAEIDETRRATLIAVAESRTGSVYPSGDVRNMAVALLAAHTLAVVDGAGGRAVSSESVGPLSISYATATGISDLSSTGYGRQLLELQQAYVFAPRTRLG